MLNYYDSDPTHRLQRFLGLVSFLNPLSRGVGKTLAALTGARLVVLDEAIEHRFGASAHEILAEHGLAGWRRAETRELRAALDSRPPGILVLGEGTLSEPANRTRVGSEADLLYLYQSFGDVQHSMAALPRTKLATLMAEGSIIPGSGEERVRALYDIRDSEYRRGSLRFEVSRSSRESVALELMALLERRGTLTHL